MHVLHHQHTAEDITIWPALVRRAPMSKPALDRLEAQHEAMDPLFAGVTDTSQPVGGRADDLQALHDLLNDHLDEEERVAVPLIQRHISAAEWAKDGEEVSSAIDRRRLPPDLRLARLHVHARAAGRGSAHGARGAAHPVPGGLVAGVPAAVRGPCTASSRWGRTPRGCSADRAGQARATKVRNSGSGTATATSAKPADRNRSGSRSGSMGT